MNGAAEKRERAIRDEVLPDPRLRPMTMERPPYALGARTPLALQQRKQTLELALHMSKSLCTTRNASSTMREAGVVQLLRQIMADCNGGTDADATLIAAAVCLLDVSCAPFPSRTHNPSF